MQECTNSEALQKKDNIFRKWFASFKLRVDTKKILQSSVSGFVLAVVLACVLFLNIILGILGNSFNLKLDLTRSKMFTLSADAVNFVKNIDKDVELIVLNDENSFSEADKYFKQANSVLRRFSQLSNKIRLSYVDVVKNPTYLKDQEFASEKLTTNSVIVRSGKKYKIINVSDLFDISYGYYGSNEITASKAEQELTSAILYAVSNNQKKIAFLTGYEESDSFAFMELLKKNNYNVVEVNLLTDNVPADVSAAIVFAPSRDYDDVGIKKLNSYLSVKGSNLLYAANPELVSSPRLNDFLNQWKIKVKDGLVYETDFSKMTSNRRIFEAICEKVEEGYTQKVKDSKLPVLLPVCRPLEAIDRDSVKILLSYSNKSGIMPQGAGEGFDIKSNICGPVPVALISGRDVEGEKSTVTVLGSFVGLTDNYLQATSLNNSSYFSCLLDNLTKKEDSGIVIAPKRIDNEELGINGVQANVLGLGVTVLLPLLVIICGVLMFLKRRNM